MRKLASRWCEADVGGQLVAKLDAENVANDKRGSFGPVDLDVAVDDWVLGKEFLNFPIALFLFNSCKKKMSTVWMTRMRTTPKSTGYFSSVQRNEERPREF